MSDTTLITIDAYPVSARWCNMKLKNNYFWRPRWQAEYGGRGAVRAYTRRGVLKKAQKAASRH